jgi:SAM-dependent methyltransferase
MSSYDPFAEIYDEWSAHMTADVPFYVELAREAEGPIVELAVGSGRVAIPVAQETGRTVIGIDSSPAMLALARERALAAGVRLDLREADMRELELEEPAGLVWEYVEHSKSDNRIDVTAFGGEPGAEPRTISVWWATRSEWEGLVAVAGLEVEALYGWFDRRRFDDQSPEFVWIARRPT